MYINTKKRKEKREGGRKGRKEGRKDRFQANPNISVQECLPMLRENADTVKHKRSLGKQQAPRGMSPLYSAGWQKQVEQRGMWVVN